MAVLVTGVAGFGYDTANAQEIQITIAGGLGETDRGGPAFNMIPRTGGNNFSGTYFLSYAGEWAQSSNLDDELRSYGITEVPGLIKNYDTNFALGGPIVRDKLWFFANARTFGSASQVPGLYGNANAGNPNAPTDPVHSESTAMIAGVARPLLTTIASVAASMADRAFVTDPASRRTWPLMRKLGSRRLGTLPP